MSKCDIDFNSIYQTQKKNEEWINNKFGIHGVTVNGEITSSEGRKIVEKQDEMIDFNLPRFCIDDLREGNIVQLVFSDRINETPYRVNNIIQIDKDLYKLHLEPYYHQANNLSATFCVTEQGRISQNGGCVFAFPDGADFSLRGDEDIFMSSRSKEGTQLSAKLDNICVIPDEIILSAYNKEEKIVAGGI